MKVGKRAKLRHAATIADDPELHLESQLIELESAGGTERFRLRVGRRADTPADLRQAVGADVKIALGGLALTDGHVGRHDARGRSRRAAGVSREFYRSIVADEAVGVFQGKIVVAPGAQKTDGAMKSQAVLLSPQAQMNDKPELEIFADDVICGHGATVASIDPEMVFYLRSAAFRKRGESDAARSLGVGSDRPRRRQALRRGLASAVAAWLGGDIRGTIERDDGGERVNDMVRPVEPYDVARFARISRSSPNAHMGSRSSISTTPPRPRSRRR